MVALALVHDDLTTIHSDLTAIRTDLDKIAADTGYQAGVIRTAEGSVKALANRLKEVIGFPPAALTPEQTYDLATAAAAAVTGMSIDDVKRLTTAPMEDIPKPALVTPQPSAPARPPIEERIRQLRQRGIGGYDAALQLMREHYPMQEIVSHLHVSPRRIAELRKGEARKHE
jgi:hypothetical protein